MSGNRFMVLTMKSAHLPRALPQVPENCSLPQNDASSSPKQQDLFGQLSVGERRSFLAKCKEQHFDAGAHLFTQGQPYTESYLICSGIVRTYYVSPTGKEITIAYWSEGALVGGPNIFYENRPHIWSAQSATQVVTQGIRGRELEELSMRLPRLAHYLIETLTFKLHWVSVLLQTFGTESVRSRLAHLLLHLSEHWGAKQDNGILITQQFSHEELARMVGATRPWVTLTLRDFKREEILACRGRHLVILNQQGLEKSIHPRSTL